MTRKHALLDGIGRALGGARFLLLVYLFNLGIAVAMAAVVADSIEDSLGSSAASDRLLEGWDAEWYAGYRKDADGLAGTFDPEVLGIGAVFDAVDDFLSGRFRQGNKAVLGAAVLYLLAWTFLSAGLIRHFRRPREGGSFFHQCARFFPRFLVLGILAGALYYLIFIHAAPALSEWVRSETRNVVHESTAFVYTAIKYAAIGAMLLAVNLLFDYGKIITVARNRLFILATPFEAFWFIVRHPLKTVGLYLAVGLLWIALVGAYWLYAYLTPDTDQKTVQEILLALGVGQVFILGRIFVKGIFLGSQTALYEKLTPALDAPPATPEDPEELDDPDAEA